MFDTADELGAEIRSAMQALADHLNSFDRTGLCTSRQPSMGVLVPCINRAESKVLIGCVHEHMSWQQRCAQHLTARHKCAKCRYHRTHPHECVSTVMERVPIIDA